jgi:hypothetical protein
MQKERVEPGDENDNEKNNDAICLTKALSDDS